MKKVILVAATFLLLGASCNVKVGGVAVHQSDTSSRTEQKRNIKQGLDTTLGITFQYPEGYTVEPARESHAVTIRSGVDPITRVEIWNRAESQEHVWGFTDEPVTQAELDDYMPKHIIDIDLKGKKYKAYMYYGAGNEDVRPELDIIVNSLKAL